MKAIQALVPGFTAALERTPGTLATYRDLCEAMEQSLLPIRCRMQIALVVAQRLRCHYAAWVHSVLASEQGLNGEDVLLAGAGSARDPHEAAILKVASRMIAGDELLDPSELIPVATRGIGETVVAQVAAQVAYALMTCYVLQSVAPTANAPAPAKRAP